MIRRVFANKPSFRQVSFEAGLNIVLAERDESASAGDSRNGVGKSTLVEIIHYCLGSSAGTDHPLRRRELEGWVFSVELDVVGLTTIASRSSNEPGRIGVSTVSDDWPIAPKIDDDTGETSYSLDQWKTILGWGFFGLPVPIGDTEKYRPSYRKLFSYVCRRHPAAYQEPFKHLPSQAAWDSQLHVAFLLGLGWRNVSSWQRIRDELDGLDALKKAAKAGVVAGFVGTEGELEAKRVEVETRLAEQQSGLASFKVHPEYERLQEDANRLTAEIQKLTRTGVMLRRKRDLYTTAIADEAPPSEDALEAMYSEAGIALGEGVQRTLAEARNFHRQLVSNRQEYLGEELQRLESELEGLDRAVLKRSNERADLFSVLETHGAFDEFARLSDQAARTRQEHEAVSERLFEVRGLKERRQELRAEKIEVERSAHRDYDERRDTWSAAVRTFSENSEALYDSPGQLIIDVSESRYKFEVNIERQGSHGIAKMEVFCFDLMVAEQWSSKDRSPGCLIHDSILFDGVDSRQIARALMRANNRSQQCGFQYICTLNTDMIPIDDLDEDFDISEFVRLTLNDGDAAGSLLGIRF